MKRAQAAVVTVLLFAAHGAAYAAGQSTFPADAEASYSLPAPDTYADMHARKGGEQSEVWGVGKRGTPVPHDAFPFGGGPTDD